MKKIYCEKCGCQLKKSAACGKCGNINYQFSDELKKQNSVRLWAKVGVLSAGAVVIAAAVLFPAMFGQVGSKRDIEAAQAYVDANYPGAVLAEELYSPDFLSVTGDNGAVFSLDGVEFTVMASGGEVVSDDHDIACALSEARENLVEPFFADSSAKIEMKHSCRHLEPGYIHDVWLPVEQVRCVLTFPEEEGEQEPWKDYPMYEFYRAWADSGLEYYRVDIHFTDISDNKDYWWAQFSDHYPVDSADEMSERFEYMGGNSW